MVPTFYDSIEFARERMGRKFQARSARWTMLPAFFVTFVEAVLTLTFIRLIYRSVVRGFRFATGRGRGKTVPLATQPVVKVTEGV